MSEQDQTGEGTSLKEVPNIAAAYLDAIEEEPDQERLDEIESKINELESKQSEVASNVGEDHFLVKEIEGEIQDLENEREELRQSTEDVTDRRNELLRAATDAPGFQLDEHWLNPDVLRALTHVLYESKDEELVVADQALSEPEDADGLDRMQEIQIKREIVNIARDRLSADQRVAERWREFEDTRPYPAFQAIVNEPGVGPGEIAEMQDDASDSTVRDWTSDLSNQEVLKMVYTPKRGSYHPSTVGKYYAAHYAAPSDMAPDDTGGADRVAETDDSSDEESMEEAAESTEPSEDVEQLDLGNSTERPDDQPEGTGATDQGVSVTSSAADSTEDKAEAMFENIGEGSNTNE